MAPAQGWHANSWSVPNFCFSYLYFTLTANTLRYYPTGYYCYYSKKSAVRKGRLDESLYDITGRQKTMFTNFTNISLDEIGCQVHITSIRSNEMSIKSVNFAFCLPVKLLLLLTLSRCLPAPDSLDQMWSGQLYIYLDHTPLFPFHT